MHDNTRRRIIYHRAKQQGTKRKRGKTTQHHFKDFSTHWHKSRPSINMVGQTANSLSGTTHQGQGNETDGTQVIAPPKHVFTNWMDYMTLDHRYADEYTLDTTTTNGQSQQWRTNSIFDPDLTGVGHQPKGSDTYRAIYDYYRVLNCHYKITFCNLGSVPIIYGLLKSADVTDFTNATQLIPLLENPALMECGILDIEGSDNGLIVLEGDLGPEDFTVDIVNQKDAEVWTPVGSSPNVIKILALNTAPYNGTANSEVNLIAEFVYTVQWRQVNATVRNTSS